MSWRFGFISRKVKSSTLRCSCFLSNVFNSFSHVSLLENSCGSDYNQKKEEESWSGIFFMRRSLIWLRVGLAHTHTWLANSRGAHEADECDVWGAAGLQGDRVDPEVLQHIKDGLKPKVLHSALTVLVQGQTEVLKGGEQVIKGQIQQWITGSTE